MQYLLVGSDVVGLLFSAPQLMFGESERHRYGAGLNLESRWVLYATLPSSFPDNEVELPKRTQDEDLALLCSLRHKMVRSVELGERLPHLILTFTDGTVLFVNGEGFQFEAWTAGSHAGGEYWDVVAGVAGNVSVWAPESFLASSGLV
jgi:hypothetical protein